MNGDLGKIAGSAARDEGADPAHRRLLNLCARGVPVLREGYILQMCGKAWCRGCFVLDHDLSRQSGRNELSMGSTMG